jgi:hypothetical protein
MKMTTTANPHCGTLTLSMHVVQQMTVIEVNECQVDHVIHLLQP